MHSIRLSLSLKHLSFLTFSCKSSDAEACGYETERLMCGTGTCMPSVDRDSVWELLRRVRFSLIFSSVFSGIVGTVVVVTNPPTMGLTGEWTFASKSGQVLRLIGELARLFLRFGEEEEAWGPVELEREINGNFGNFGRYVEKESERFRRQSLRLRPNPSRVSSCERSKTSCRSHLVESCSWQTSPVRRDRRAPKFEGQLMHMPWSIICNKRAKMCQQAYIKSRQHVVIVNHSPGPYLLVCPRSCFLVRRNCQTKFGHHEPTPATMFEEKWISKNCYSCSQRRPENRDFPWQECRLREE
jgi:hypothetical protein